MSWTDQLEYRPIQKSDLPQVEKLQVGDFGFRSEFCSWISFL